MGSLSPGVGKNDKDGRRLEKIERYIGQFKTHRIFARNQLGDVREFQVLAIEGGFGEEDEIAPDSSGSFFGLFVDDDGDTYLQAGTITGGHGGEAMIDNYKVLDAQTGVGTLEGERLYLKVNITATVADLVMLPGAKVNSGELTKTLPSQHSFTVSDKTGDIFREVGQWTENTFLPSTTGGLSQVTGCIGNFSII